jgi:hypothetical protein
VETYSGLKRSCQTYVISRVIPIVFSYFPSGVLHESNCVLMFDVLSCFCFDPHDDVSGILGYPRRVWQLIVIIMFSSNDRESDTEHENQSTISYYYIRIC